MDSAGGVVVRWYFSVGVGLTGGDSAVAVYPFAVCCSCRST
jgi:hypothetical protein